MDRNYSLRRADSTHQTGWIHIPIHHLGNTANKIVYINPLSFTIPIALAPFVSAGCRLLVTQDGVDKFFQVNVVTDVGDTRQLSLESPSSHTLTSSPINFLYYARACTQSEYPAYPADKVMITDEYGIPGTGTVTSDQLTLISTMSTSNLFQARLSADPSTPVTIVDEIDVSAIHLVPYKGNNVGLYNGTTWESHTLSTYITHVCSSDSPDAANTVFDVFVYDNAGTLELEVVAWASSTARATGLAVQDGVYVQTGDTTKRYCGTFSTTAVEGMTEDSKAKRYIWNYYNRSLRQMKVAETTDTWTYQVAAFRQANNNTANQLGLVIGVSEDAVKTQVHGIASNNVGSVRTIVGIGIDSTTVNSADLTLYTFINQAGMPTNPSALYNGYVGIGRHYLAWLEYSDAANTTTWRGDSGDTAKTQTGILGEIWA